MEQYDHQISGKAAAVLLGKLLHYLRTGKKGSKFIRFFISIYLEGAIVTVVDYHKNKETGEFGP